MADQEQLMQEFEKMKERLQVLGDKEEIRDLLCRYSYNADLGRDDGFVQLFTEDAIWEAQTLEFPVHSFSRRAPIQEKRVGREECVDG